MMALGFLLMGLTYGPLGTVLSELFPTQVRYTGSSLAFNFAGIPGRLGGALHCHLARENLRIAIRRLLPLTTSAVLTLIGLLLIRETKDESLVTLKG